MQNNQSISISSDQYSNELNLKQKLALSMIALGVLQQLIFWFMNNVSHASLHLISSLTLIIIGSLSFSRSKYKDTIPGIKNNNIWHDSLTNRGILAWTLGIFLTAFYIILYWYPQYLGLATSGQSNKGLIALFDPLSYFFKSKPASEWFVYGTLYTLIINLMGIKFIYKYRHNRYQIFRTISIMFFQTCIAFILPEIMLSLNLPFNDFKNIWPLNYYFFFDWHISELIGNGLFGYFILFWGIISFAIITPVMTYYFGKRWYCSWVCGCGGLAETAGDPFRQLSDKSLRAWRIERWLIHAVLVFVTLMTVMVLYTRFTGQASLLFFNSYYLSKWYGFFIGAAFSGVVGVGFYPIFGSRVWCRFGCPMAAYLGLIQRLKLKFTIAKKEINIQSKFRITTNGGQCISCGNCSTYCEMGIDVKSYAQRQEDIVRASCVGCGICSAVCPRGVLKLENL